MISEYLVTKVLEGSFRRARTLIKGVLEEKHVKMLTTREEIEQSLHLHLKTVSNWSDEVSFSDLKRAKLTSEIFIELDLFIYPRRIRITNETIKSIPLSEMFSDGASHYIILGQPGAGKTTSMKFLCQQILHNDKFYPDRFSLPLLVRFRELNNEKHEKGSPVLFEHLFRILGLNLKFPASLEGSSEEVVRERRDLRERTVLTLLETMNVLLVLEGFDELGSESIRTMCISEIRRLAQSLNKSTLVVTSRTGDFRYNVANADPYELCPLDREQVSQFSLKWLRDPDKAKKFLKKIYQTPFADTAIRPLTLAHLCAIYERIEDIPEKPKTIYKRIVNLLLEEWDQQRTIKRKSKYAHFELDRKYEFLCHLAYVLTVGLKRTVFSSYNLEVVYERICDQYGLERSEAKEVAAEIETHTGLLLKSGYDEFEFAHKSLQEFLTAEYLVKLPTIPSWETLAVLPNEIAIAVAVSSNPGAYFEELVLRRFSTRISEDFLRAFLNRLVIEKPDFGSEPGLLLAILSLVSRYLELSFIGEGRPWSFQGGQLLAELERIVHRNYTAKLTEMLKCYVTDRIYETKNLNFIHKLTLKGSVPKTFVFLRNHFPKTLYVPTSFVGIKSPELNRTNKKDID